MGNILGGCSAFKHDGPAAQSQGAGVGQLAVVIGGVVQNQVAATRDRSGACDRVCPAEGERALSCLLYPVTACNLAADGERATARGDIDIGPGRIGAVQGQDVGAGDGVVVGGVRGGDVADGDRGIEIDGAVRRDEVAQGGGRVGTGCEGGVAAPIRHRSPVAIGVGVPSAGLGGCG